MSGATHIDIRSQVKRTAKDSLIYLPAKVIPAVIGIVLIRVLTTVFTPEEYGYYQITLSTFGLIRVIGMIWLSTSVIRFYLNYRNRRQESTFFSTLFVCVIISAVAVALISFFVNLFVFKNRIVPALFYVINIAIVASVFNAFFEVFVVVFRAGLEPRKYSLFWILFAVGKPLLGVALVVFFGLGVDGIFWGFLVIPFALDIITFAKLDLHKHVRLSAVSISLFQQFAKYGIPIGFSFFSFWMLTLSDRYLIGLFRSSAEVGLYSVGYTISEKTLNFVYMILMLAAYPIIVDNWEKHGDAETQRLITELTRYFFFVCVPILTVLVIMPEQVLAIFSSRRFMQGATVLPFIAIGFFLHGLTQYVLKGFELHKRSSRIAMLAFLAGLVNICSNLVLIPRLGFLGAGVSACFAHIVYFSTAVYFARSEMAWHPPYKSIVNTVAAAVVFAIFLNCAALASQNMLLTALLVIPSGAVIYLLTLILLREIRTSEIRKGLYALIGNLKG